MCVRVRVCRDVGNEEFSCEPIKLDMLYPNTPRSINSKTTRFSKHRRLPYDRQVYGLKSGLTAQVPEELRGLPGEISTLVQ